MTIIQEFAMTRLRFGCIRFEPLCVIASRAKQSARAVVTDSIGLPAHMQIARPAGGTVLMPFGQASPGCRRCPRRRTSFVLISG